MIALTIFATLAAAVISAGHYSLRQNVRLKEQMQCAWLADNQLTELRLQAPSPGRSQLLRHIDRRDWVLDQTITPAGDSRMLKVEISVRPQGSEQPVYSTTSWVPAAHE